MENRLLWAAAAAVALSAVAAPAAAQFQKPEDAIKHRRSAMSLMNTHLGRLFAMANGRQPYDPATAALNAEVLAAVSKVQFQGFVEGTASGDTRAKPEIWRESDKFKAAAQRSNADVDKLVAAARSGSLDALKAATGTAGQSCKACHDEYRKD